MLCCQHARDRQGFPFALLTASLPLSPATPWSYTDHIGHRDDGRVDPSETRNDRYSLALSLAAASWSVFRRRAFSSLRLRWMSCQACKFPTSDYIISGVCPPSQDGNQLLISGYRLWIDVQTGRAKNICSEPMALVSWDHR